MIERYLEVLEKCLHNRNVENCEALLLQRDCVTAEFSQILANTQSEVSNVS